MADNLGVRMRSLPPLLLRHPANAEIVRFLQEQTPSAHGDLTSEMVLAAQGLRGVHSFAPMPATYSYELLHTDDGVIFAVAVGRSTLLLRIPSITPGSDLERYGAAFPPLGPEWVALSAFQPQISLAEWRAFLSRTLKQALRSVV